MESSSGLPNADQDLPVNSSKNEGDVDVVIPKETIMRLLKDIRSIVTSSASLEDEGIMYKHSETDILTGYACIVGPADSLYFGGYYFFKFSFPTNYPHSPPIVYYLTNDGYMRFHPNFYVSQKICLSMLNSWRGEQWTGCQTIRSILMTFVSLLDKEPLLHEPGIRQQHQDFKSYHVMVEYKNYEFACMRMGAEMRSLVSVEFYDCFEEFMLRHFNKNKEKIRAILEDRSRTISVGLYKISLYGSIQINVSFPSLLEKYDKICCPAIKALMNQRGIEWT